MGTQRARYLAVRGDLVKVLNKLLKRKGRFDAILIETTGLADPAPVAQTFFVDEGLAEKLQLDAIVTVVDAKHIEQHLDDEKPEGVENEVRCVHQATLSECLWTAPLQRYGGQGLPRSCQASMHKRPAVLAALCIQRLLLQWHYSCGIMHDGGVASQQSALSAACVLDARSVIPNTACCAHLQSVEQLAFADVILLNKTDLIEEEDKARILKRIKVSTSVIGIGRSHDPA